MGADATEHSSCVLLVKIDELTTPQMTLDLREAGYEVVLATELAKVPAQIRELKPALIAIDRTQTGDAGLQLCRQLRHDHHRVPVLLLLARDNVEDRVACLEAGADDYLTKPYRSEPFLRLIGLYLEPAARGTEQLRFGDLALDLTTRRAQRHGREIELTMKEFELLKYLMLHPREVVTREQILENVWGYDFMGESNVIEVYIRYLRLKVEDEGQKRLIQTVRGVGYVLREA